jgi:hypothetical protein
LLKHSDIYELRYGNGRYYAESNYRYNKLDKGETCFIFFAL